ARTCRERRRVKPVNGGAAWRAKAKMSARYRRSNIGLARNRELDAERARRGAVIGAAAEVHDTDQPERPQRRVIEAAAPVDVTHAQGNMVEHFRRAPSSSCRSF